MKFSSTRKLVLAAFGHVVTFDKGDTLFVPHSLHRQALEQGLEPVPEDGEDLQRQEMQQPKNADGRVGKRAAQHGF